MCINRNEQGVRMKNLILPFLFLASLSAIAVEQPVKKGGAVAKPTATAAKTAYCATRHCKRPNGSYYNLPDYNGGCTYSTDRCVP